jgi:hypothetical protein
MLMKFHDDFFQADDAGKELLERARPLIGKTVRSVDSPKTTIGTIQDVHLNNGQIQYLFHLDPRFRIQVADYYMDEGDFELCERPTDEYVNTVNQLTQRG